MRELTIFDIPKIDEKEVDPDNRTAA